MRNILALYNDPLLCASFCQTNDGTKLNCFELSDDEKRACGICVKNIVGLDNLDEKLQQVCYIVNTSSTSPETTVSQNENPVSTKGSMPATSTNTTISQFLSTNHVTDVKPTYTTFETSKDNCSIATIKQPGVRGAGGAVERPASPAKPVLLTSDGVAYFLGHCFFVRR
ncbi:uncharacterized protein LOC142350390 [Convolutriloba macropyga]|uniref:uncharacterized protein LOC142350390 n=1 Tax=Convolutriloba macropyga TaxID=536237 RepID=UPI003F51B29E